MHVCISTSFSTLLCTEKQSDALQIHTILAYVGDNVRLKCDSTSTPQWTKMFTSDVISNQRYLWIHNVQQRDSGKYTCTGHLLPAVHLIVGGELEHNIINRINLIGA